MCFLIYLILYRISNSQAFNTDSYTINLYWHLVPFSISTSPDKYIILQYLSLIQVLFSFNFPQRFSRQVADKYSEVSQGKVLKKNLEQSGR
jgi:hypothetical protein